MAYIEEACDQCGRIVPRNELQEVSRRVVVGGTTGTVRSYARGGLGFTSGRTEYKIERLRLCTICLAAWIAAQRARRRSIFLGVSLAILLLVAIIAALLVSARLNDAAPSPGPMNAAANASGPPADNSVGTTSTEGTVPNPIDSTSNESAPGSDAPAAVADANATPTPETTPALSKAIASALDSGATTPWQDGAQAGNVTVGPQRFYNGKPCRSFSYSTGDKTTGPLYACDGVDGVWRPTADFQVKGLY